MSGIEPVTLALAAALAVLALGLVAALLRRPALPPEFAEGLQGLRDQQVRLEGRLDQIGRDQQAQAQAITAQETALATRLGEQATALAERLAAQERALAASFDALKEQLNATLSGSAQETLKSLGTLGERLAVIDSAQKTIEALASQVTGLQNILSNKQARGAFGEAQLEALVRDVLAPSDYAFQHTLSNGTRVDCLLKLADPPGPIGVDSKFPLESFRRLRDAATEADRTAAARQFRADVLKHVKDVGAKYILAGETADGALLFVPSEAIYAALHAEFEEVIDEAFRARVWIVSPTTMMAILNTMRAVLRDVRMRQEARKIQDEVGKLADDVRRLSGRVENLKKHFGQAQEDVRQIEISADKITGRAERITEVRLEEPSPPLPTPRP